MSQTNHEAGGGGEKNRRPPTKRVHLIHTQYTLSDSLTFLSHAQRLLLKSHVPLFPLFTVWSRLSVTPWRSYRVSRSST